MAASGRIALLRYDTIIASIRLMLQTQSECMMCQAVWWVQVLDNGGVEFTNEGSGARLRVFAALKHRFMKQAGLRFCTFYLTGLPHVYIIGP